MAQNINFPQTTITKLPDSLAVENSEQKVLFIGQQLAAGSATTGELITQIGDDNSWDTLFGAKSMIAAMIRSGRSVNGVTRFDAIPLDDNGSGVDATSIATFTGTSATEAGTITIFLGSEVDYFYELPIAIGDTPTTIGSALETAINADTNAPFTGANVTGAVTMTAENAGEEANSFLIESEGTVAGITLTLTGWTGGATNPTLTDIFDVIGEERYQTIIWPGSYAITEVQDLLDGRWNIDGKPLDGVTIRSITDTLVNVKAAAETLNSQSIITFGDETTDNTTYKGGSVAEINTVTSSLEGAIRALRLTQDANIAQFVATSAAKDQFGSPSIATLPYGNTPLTSIPTVKTGLGWTRTEINELADAGVSVIGNNRSNSNVVMGQLVTSYLTDTSGNPDPTYKFLNAVDTISNVSEYLYNNLVSDFQQTRLTLGGLRQGFDINNEKSIKAQMVKYYQDLTGEVYLLLQEGEDALNFFKDNLIVTIDLVAGTVTIECKVPILTQLRTILATVKVAFDIEA
ncbi:hypothetical protein KAR91_10540 [Candidatus Pacearchaeota archaeon]|nr:hypothetical protein [Candidatus Pacearchaeota archaeon]